jgi:hypothetical protein
VATAATAPVTTRAAARPSGLLHDEVPEIARRLALETAKAPGLPLAILLGVGLFLLVQHRIDRKDPKLAHLAVTQEVELPFGPPAGRARPSGDERD